ncbi:MAG: superoxide dismutase [Bacteroidia bacterium]|jgi:Fe-Mn family superoxide dismutase|nr:superoxide dismutase [Bacteroidia bacterium]
MTKRRDFLKQSSLLSFGTLSAYATPALAKELLHFLPHATLFELPPLGYAYDSLEPFIDAQTMQIHHTKHHQAYVTKLNEAVAKDPALHHQSLEQLIRNSNSFPEASRAAIRNHGGGHWNHSFFWTLLQKGTQPGKVTTLAINNTFGSMEQFKVAFEKAALGLFGSGWTWLMKDASGKLTIISTPNQDNPLMDIAPQKGTPIIGIDVWEHAYYLKYQNKRADYVQAFWNVLNWNKVEEFMQK